MQSLYRYERESSFATFLCLPTVECALCVFNEDDYHAIQNLYRYDGMAFECGTCLCLCLYAVAVHRVVLIGMQS